MSIINYDIDDVQYIDVDFHNITQTSTAYAKQYDTKTRYIVATVWKDGMPYTIPSGWNVAFRATKPDGKGLSNPCVIEDGKIVYQMTIQTTTVDGMFDCEFVMSTGVDDTLKTISCPKFRMRVEKAALTEETILSTDEISELTGLIKEAKDLVAEVNILTDEMEGLIEEGNTLYSDLETSEAARVAAENIRVTKETDRQAKESARVTAETGRASAETNRVNAESARVAKEATRVTAETDRVNKESARVTAESGRVSAEDKRVTAESARATAEGKRVTAENARVSAETARDTAETKRATAETDRVNKESARVTAETGRASAESTRVTAETARVNAEKARDTAESARKTQETTRQSQESTRQLQETTRVSQETARQDYYNAYKVCEPYSPTKPYVVGNKVIYQGSTYQNIKESTGVLPTVDTNWILIAAKGTDGVGGDMFKSYYDPQNKEQDIFAYADKIEDRLDNQIGTANGASINLPNTFNGGLLLKELQGKSVQNGTPTPETKADIVSVGDDGSVVVKVTGKNLLPKTSKTEELIRGVTYSPNSDGSIVVNGTAPSDLNSDFYLKGAWASNVTLFVLPKGTYTLKSTNTSTSKVKILLVSGSTVVNSTANTSADKTFTLNADTPITGYYLQVGAGDTANYTAYPQLELSSTATTYEPYKEQLVTIPLTQPLRSVGSVYDRIIKKDGVWGIERNIAKVVFDGSSDEGWIPQSTNTAGVNRCQSPLLKNLIKPTPASNDINNFTCDRYPTVSAADTWNKIYGFSVDRAYNVLVYNEAYTTGDISKFTTALATTPVTVIYESATPIFEPFTQAIQDQLNKLQTYQGVTNVFTTDALQPTLSVNYGKTDSSALVLYGANVIDNKLDKSSVANNLITTVEGTVLDGRQGKALNDKIGDLSSLTTTSKTDLAKAVNEVKTGVDNVDTNVKNQIGTANGATINLPNSFNGGLLLKELQGKSVQNGTPTPDAKVDIVSVGDNGSVVVKVDRKNLIDFSNPSFKTTGVLFKFSNDTFILNSNSKTYSRVQYDINHLRGMTVILSYASKTSSVQGSVVTIDITYSLDGVTKYAQLSSAFTIPNNASNIYLRLVANDTSVANSNILTIMKPQLELGSTATSYEPYKEQLVTIPLTQPLRSVGSVYDRIIKKAGVWGVERNIPQVVFDGSSDEEWITSAAFTDDTYLCAYFPSLTIKPDSKTLCNKFINGRYIEGKASEMVGSISKNINICILKSRLSTPDINGLKAWLVLNPITVQYQLATPTFEPYSQAIQDKLNALQTYQGVTNVFTTDALQPNMIVEYGKTDTSALSLYANNVSDSKLNISQLPTSLPANGGNADTVNGFTVESSVPANAKFTDTVYNHPATHPASMITGLPSSLPANGGNADTIGGVSINDICKVSKSILGDIDWDEVEISFNTWYAFTPETINTPSGYGYIQRIKLSATDWYFDVAYNTDGNRSTRENINGQGWTKWRIIETDNPIINLKKYGAVGDGVVDDTKAFKDALVVLEAVGGTLLVPRGVYLIQDVLYIPQNSKIVGDGEVFLKRNADISALMLTKTDPLIGGYDGFKNVVIENIGFDGASSNFIPTCTLFASYHARNVIIKNCKFQNLDAWHMVEFNSTSDSKIIDCEFYNYGYSGSGGASEMVQLDFAYESGYPWQGLWDNTPCSNITIKNNVFRNSTMDAIGNHSYLEGAASKNITIENNVFDNILGVCVDLNDIDTLIVINNNFKLSPVAIRINAQKNVNENIIINSNYYKYKVSDPYVGIEARFVMINQTGTLPYDTRNITISDNIVDGANTHAIGMTANNVIISNNKISGAYKNGIYLYGGENYVISNNILTGSGLNGFADLAVGNNGVITTIKVIVSGNIIDKLIIGANYDNVFIHGNTITSITQGNAISKNNIINGSYVS